MILKKRVDNITNKVFGHILGTRLVRKIFKKGVQRYFKWKWIEWIYVLLLLSFSAGIMNTILEGSRGASSLSVSMTMANMFVFILGTSGIYLMYFSGKYAVKQRIANTYFALGLLILIMTLFIGYSL